MQGTDLVLDNALLIAIVTIIATLLRLIELRFFNGPKQPNPNLDEHRMGELPGGLWMREFDKMHSTLQRIDDRIEKIDDGAIKELTKIGTKLDTLIREVKRGNGV